MKNLKEQIEESQFVLIGIGEEFALNSDNHDRLVNAYNKIEELVQGKNYYVITTCYDDVIFESKLNKDKITAPCGSMKRVQCENGCENVIGEDINAISVCPACGGKMISNNIEAAKYNEEGYIESWKKYNLWLTTTLNRNLTLIELGDKLKYPSVVRWPFEKVTVINNKAYMYRINEKLSYLTEDLKGKAESVKINSLEYIEKYC